MEFRNLQSDEFEYECLLRGVDPESVTVIQKLNDHEKAGTAYNFDAVWTGKCVNSEVQLIFDRKEIIERQLIAAIEAEDLVNLEIGESRARHLMNRVLTVSHFSPNLPSASRLTSELEQVLVQIWAAIRTISGQVPEQAQIPSPLLEQPVSRTLIVSSTGAIPKNLDQTQKNKQSDSVPNVSMDFLNQTGIIARHDYLPSRSTQPQATQNQGQYQASLLAISQSQPDPTTTRSNNNSDRPFNPQQNMNLNQNQSASNNLYNNQPPLSNFNLPPNQYQSSLFQLSQYGQQPHQQPTQPHQQPQHQQPNNNSQNNIAEISSVFRNNRNPLASWPIKFDGNSSILTVEEFIFRIGVMAEGENISSQILASGLHYLLSGNALTWYWLFKRYNRNASWDEIQVAMRTEFQSRDSDYEIKKCADNMRQNLRELFCDFKLRVESQLSKLKHPISDFEKLSMLKRNVNPELRKALFYRHTRTITELLNVCRDYEKLSTQLGEDRQNVNRRYVNEIDSSQPGSSNDQFSRDYSEIHYPSTGNTLECQQIEQIDAGKSSTYVICWNCRDLGHLFKDCPKPIPTGSIFCFGCGTPNVLKPKCLKCMGNRRPSLMSSGARAQSQNPETTNPFRIHRRQ